MPAPPRRSPDELPVVNPAPVHTVLIYYGAAGVFAAVLAAAVPWFQDGVRVVIPFAITLWLADGVIRLSESKRIRGCSP